ncbi:MAG: DUF1794 domain-containing protein [Streptosporangiales bacterium]|nr:DUF1794 domain-containing protein [Streptosporangiales bacterium]
MAAADSRGPELHPACLPLAFLLGTWRGTGVGGYPTLEQDFTFVQQVTFGHVGKPFLSYESRSWLTDENGEPTRPGAMEYGFWRPVGSGQLELVLSHPTGVAEIWYGEITGTKIELATDAVARTSTAKEVTGGKRLYGLVEGDLAYAYDLAAVGQPLQAHLSARLVKT